MQGSTRVLLMGFVAAAAVAAATAVAGEPQVPGSISQHALFARLTARDTALVVLDVRTAAEFASGHIPGARNVAHERIMSQVAELADARDKDIVVYSRSGRRTQHALRALKSAGFARLLRLEGEFLAWQASGWPIESASLTARPAADSAPR